ncbi:MAG: hypothetical protein JXQ71_10315 [Verrucomicrobia bacterium]|nr:hypothetical protein [Verrucomicrobiota bacterium]
MPLELSELWLNGATLWDWSQESDFLFALRQGLELLQAGQGVYSNRKPVPAVIAGFEAAYLTGGRVHKPLVREPLAGLPFPVHCADQPVCAAALAGLDWLRAHAGHGWVLDLGNSQLKLAAPGRHWVLPRDWTRLHAVGRVPAAQVPIQSRRLREFIASAFRSALVETGAAPAALLCALPARVAEDGSPAASSYPGMKSDRRFLSDALALAGLTPVPVYVLNDAELAALGALADPRLTAYGKVLVLTLGFGIGAALIHRAS